MGGWRRLWILVSGIYLILVIVVASSTFPNPKSVQQTWVLYDKMRPESKDKLVYDVTKPEYFSPELETSPIEKPRWDDAATLEKKWDEASARLLVTTSVTAEMPNGHILRFKVEQSKKDREAVAQEYWNIVKAEANRMRIRHLLLSFLWFIIPVAALYGLGWSLGWVHRGFKGRSKPELARQ